MEGRDDPASSRPSLVLLAAVFARLSLLGFGGPNAHVALMLDEVVERRRWLTRDTFAALLGATNLLPGPNSSEMAIHVGWTQRGWRGALVSGLAFLAPTFVLVVVLSWLYFSFGTLPRVDAVLAGLAPVVLALIAFAAWKLARTTATAPWLWMLVVAGAVLASLGSSAGTSAGGAVPESPVATVAPGAAGAAGAAPGADPATVTTVFGLHLAVGALLFGGGYVLVALLEPLAVGRFGWLTGAQFLDGVAITQAVPGPISTLSAFVGWGAAGPAGAFAGTLGLYLPAFVAVLLVAPHVERVRAVPGWRRFLAGVSALAAGGIAGVAAGMAPAVLTDVPAWVLFGGALAAQGIWRVPAIALVGAGLALGAAQALV